MPIADVSPGVSIAYETFGDPGASPVLLVMGFGAQLTPSPLEGGGFLAHFA